LGFCGRKFGCGLVEILWQSIALFAKV